ncbi:MAG: B12-binding domain-containing radical SAM protein, partial [Mastigocladus sp. ERB_26_1]
LPSNIPIYDVVELDLKAPAATQGLEAAEYVLMIAVSESSTATQWQDWLDTIKQKSELWYEQTTKSGKTQLVNLRDRLFEMELLEITNVVPQSAVSLRYLGSCRPDGTLLRPEQILFMLEQVSGKELQLLQIHRRRLLLGD